MQRLDVRIWNHGTGPMLIERLTASHPESGEGQIMEIIPRPPHGFAFADYGNFQDAHPVPPGTNAVIIEARFDPARDAEKAYHQALRDFLAKTTIHCAYTDVYGSRFADYVVGLDWFGRG